MPTNSGLLIFFDEEQRRALLQPRSDGRQRFSDALSIPDWKLRALEIGLRLIQHYYETGRAVLVAHEK